MYWQNADTEAYGIRIIFKDMLQFFFQKRFPVGEQQLCFHRENKQVNLGQKLCVNNTKVWTQTKDSFDPCRNKLPNKIQEEIPKKIALRQKMFLKRWKKIQTEVQN